MGNQPACAIHDRDRAVMEAFNMIAAGNVRENRLHLFALSRELNASAVVDSALYANPGRRAESGNLTLLVSFKESMIRRMTRTSSNDATFQANTARWGRSLADSEIRPGAMAQTESPITPIEPSETPTDNGTVTVSGRYFGDTGHNLKAPFLRAWQAAERPRGIGAPISEERFQEGVGVTQSFQAVSLVFDPGLEAPWDDPGYAHL